MKDVEDSRPRPPQGSRQEEGRRGPHLQVARAQGMPVRSHARDGTGCEEEDGEREARHGDKERVKHLHGHQPRTGECGGQAWGKGKSHSPSTPGRQEDGRECIGRGRGGGSTAVRGSPCTRQQQGARDRHLPCLGRFSMMMITVVVRAPCNVPSGSAFFALPKVNRHLGDAPGSWPEGLLRALPAPTSAHPTFHHLHGRRRRRGSGKG